jgi:hypothetical protein
MHGTIKGMTLIGLLLLICGVARACCSASGTVLNRNNQPIPGLSVYLVHPRAGRSAAKTTNNAGTFNFDTVPPQNDSYYLEIYWGKQLQYRKPVIVNRDTNFGVIRL